MADQALEKVERSHLSNKQSETILTFTAAHCDTSCENIHDLWSQSLNKFMYNTKDVIVVPVMI